MRGRFGDAVTAVAEVPASEAEPPPPPAVPAEAHHAQGTAGPGFAQMAEGATQPIQQAALAGFFRAFGERLTEQVDSHRQAKANYVSPDEHLARSVEWEKAKFEAALDKGTFHEGAKPLAAIYEELRQRPVQTLGDPEKVEALLAFMVDFARSTPDTPTSLDSLYAVDATPAGARVMRDQGDKPVVVRDASDEDAPDVEHRGSPGVVLVTEPGGALTVAAVLSDENAERLRTMRPLPTDDKSLPRWVPSRARIVDDVDDLVQELGTEQAVLERHTDPTGYPALAAGNHIVVKVAAERRPALDGLAARLDMSGTKHVGIVRHARGSQIPQEALHFDLGDAPTAAEVKSVWSAVEQLKKEDGVEADAVLYLNDSALAPRGSSRVVEHHFADANGKGHLMHRGTTLDVANENGVFAWVPEAEVSETPKSERFGSIRKAVAYKTASKGFVVDNELRLMVPDDAETVLSNHSVLGSKLGSKVVRHWALQPSDGTDMPVMALGRNADEARGLMAGAGANPGRMIVGSVSRAEDKLHLTLEAPSRRLGLEAVATLRRAGTRLPSGSFTINAIGQDPPAPVAPPQAQPPTAAAGGAGY